MKNIIVNKKELLETLKKNKEEHQKVFTEAIIGFRKDLIKQLKQHIEDIKVGCELFTYINTQDEPDDHTKEYDRAIGMLEMDTSETVELTQQDYTNFVMDEWSWKEDFYNKTMNYSSSSTSSSNSASVSVDFEGVEWE